MWSTEEKSDQQINTARSHMHIDFSWMWDDQSADQDSGPWDLLLLTQCSEGLGRPFLSLFSSRSPALFSHSMAMSQVYLLSSWSPLSPLLQERKDKTHALRIIILNFFGLLLHGVTAYFTPFPPSLPCHTERLISSSGNRVLLGTIVLIFGFVWALCALLQSPSSFGNVFNDFDGSLNVSSFRKSRWHL